MVVLVGAFVTLFAAAGWAASVRMRFPEGPAHGFLVLSDESGAAIANGELIQWLERSQVVSELVFRFADGSLYDEIVRFTQRPVFRVTSYRLEQRGPSFTETATIEFDRQGNYRVVRRPTPDAEEEHAEGRTDVPEDVSNGMTSVLLKNLPPGTEATPHVLVFRPKPRTLELHLTPEGTDHYRVGRAVAGATRFLVKPEVGGALGVLATIAGKQPPPLHMWIAEGRAPVLVRFKGPLYADGPTWRADPGAPQWDH
jgi:hypothetical protein